ncbi:MAG: lytic murein transglycosylase [Sphingomicrobium sp.]
MTGDFALRSIKGWILAGFASVAPGPASAQAVLQPMPTYAQPAFAAPTGFEAYKIWLISRARRAGIREATIQATIPGLQLNARAMELDRAQQPRPRTSSFMAPFAPYRAEHVTASLIRRGQARFAEHWPRLSQIQTSYGVDPAVVMAIYGHETSYGAISGSFDLVEALATLGYEGRRRDYFETEVLATLKLIDLGIPRWRLKGSYAGATGYPQFMPSVALRLRADGNGDGFADLWSSEDDGFASIANYLRDAGWKRGVPWGIAVRTPDTLNRAAIRSTLAPTKCARVYQRHSRWLTMAEWRALGVMPYAGRPIADTELVTLLEPDGPGATAFLLTNNYRVILDYNCSNYYALSVGLLADAIAGR